MFAIIANLHPASYGLPKSLELVLYFCYQGLRMNRSFICYMGRMSYSNFHISAMLVRVKQICEYLTFLYGNIEVNSKVI